ncbi:MAG: glycosyltransferase family 4 protein [Actinomycetota bacterium]|nr:glycosyltransferase family 4 protein [Actinomycetota bacterium]
MARRPERIDQIIPAIVEHDAVSNHTFEAQRLLRSMGFVSEIYARILGPGVEGRVHPLAELPQLAGDRQWLLYQHSIGSPAADAFVRHQGRRLLDYHNVTPAHLVERWIPPLGVESRLGRVQLAELAPKVAYAFADSGFNAAELTENGFAVVRVVPVLIESGNIEATPDPVAMARLAAEKRAGGSDWLFVGQLAPHKAQHDIVKAFACYRRNYDGKARLRLVGREMGNAYRDALRRFVAAAGLSDAVDLAGSVPLGTLAAYYATADVFVCCSDHEGFCAPIVEAMHRKIPVVAYSVAAVTETVGEGGILLPDKDPALVAAAVREVNERPRLRAQLVEAGQRQAARYSLDGARKAFVAAISEALTLP